MPVCADAGAVYIVVAAMLAKAAAAIRSFLMVALLLF
jgi:hypothetical protein